MKRASTPMRRTPMSRGQPLREERPERVRPVARPLARPANYGSPANDPHVAVPKENALQHEGYMAAVRKLACDRCGIVGFTQFCHADEGKGQSIKTDCRRGWPGCGPHGDTMGCHYLVGTSGTLTREERRAYEAEAGARTRRAIRETGAWPANLPLWGEQEQLSPHACQVVAFR